eukprot:TRINITY_DN37226_c0_g1_i1.p1 TRINITY_DN37226_c0_g1~~TRINITY_DN37226_c0_g1_i1.p1  ORF type:complete len:478 (+),score=52.29 TRINITY_DN37226_c0_g1_i1:62-1495(+)
MNPLLTILVNVPILKAYLTKEDLLILRITCKLIRSEADEIITKIDESQVTPLFERWGAMRDAIAPKEGRYPDPAASEEMINLIKYHFLFSRWPYSIEMNENYVSIANKLEQLIDDGGSIIFGGSKGPAGGKKEDDQIIGSWPCLPSLQMYYTLNCLGERNMYRSCEENPSPGVLRCFKLMFDSSVFTSDILSDWCGWDEVEYLLLTTILSLRIPEPGRCKVLHERFRYDDQADLHPSYMNPLNANVYEFMYELLEHIATCEYSKGWHVMNFVAALGYVSNSRKFMEPCLREYLTVPDGIIEIQRKTALMMCFVMRNCEMSDTEADTLRKGLKNLVQAGRKDILGIIISHWLMPAQIQLPVSAFLSSRVTRRHLIFSLLKCDGDYLVSAFFELVRRRERTPVEYLLFFKKDHLTTAVDEDGNTALLLLSGLRGRTERMVEYMLANGFDVGAKNNLGQTAFDRAAAIRNKQLLSLLPKS